MPYAPQSVNREKLEQAKQLNRLLQQLPESTWLRLAPHMHMVDLALGQILHEPEEPIHTVYFPQRAMVSLVQVMAEGTTIEAGMVGHSGMVGYPVYLGGGAGSSRAVVQLPGQAIALDAAVLKAEFERCGKLHDLLLRYTQALITQVSQIAACNRFHPIEARLARWLLQAQDAQQASQLALTQDFLSSMLGTRRASVTQAAGKLQQAGLIRYSRGSIDIIDRTELTSTACECYRLTRSEYERLLSVEV